MIPFLQDAEHQLEGLPANQKIVAVALAVTMLVVVLELVRRRKLREEYSYLWFGTALILLTLAFAPQLLSLFQAAIGAVMPTSALFFGALVFLMLLALQFSVRISRLTIRNKALSQKVALLEQELEELRGHVERPGSREVKAPEKSRKVAKDGAA